jgi:hypothetical protein
MTEKHRKCDSKEMNVATFYESKIQSSSHGSVQRALSCGMRNGLCSLYRLLIKRYEYSVLSYTDTNIHEIGSVYIVY